MITSGLDLTPVAWLCSWLIALLYPLEHGWTNRPNEDMRLCANCIAEIGAMFDTLYLC